VVIRCTRDAHIARRGQGFQARGDVHPVTVDVVFVGDDVADIYTDAEQNAPILGHVHVATGHFRPHVERVADGVDRARKLHQGAIAGGLDDPAAVLRELRVQKFGAQRLDPRQSPGLVGLHQPRVADDVGHHDHGKLSLNALFGYPLFPGDERRGDQITSIRGG
jgi:hypothetical protein